MFQYPLVEGYTRRRGGLGQFLVATPPNRYTLPTLQRLLPKFLEIGFFKQRAAMKGCIPGTYEGTRIP